MPTSGQPGGVYRIPAARNSNALSTPQNRCDHWQMNGACRFGARCRYQQAEEEKDIQDGSDFTPKNVSTAEIKRQAKESINKEARGLSALTLIRTARTQILSAQEQEGKGDLALAYASYIKTATLVKLTMDSPEYVQNAKDIGTAIRMELAEFLQNDGCDIRGRAIAVEEKLQSIETVHPVERERVERERVERERVERERVERERVERERVEKEKAEREKAEREARERREADARQRDEAVQQRNEARRVRLEAERKREREIEQARLRERFTRKQAAKEVATREHQEQMRIRREREAAAVEQYIDSESNLITCSAGMNIQRIVSGFDLCRITIKNLPNDAKLDEIADIFTQQGVDNSEFFIPQLKPNGGKHEAVVLANVDQGQNIAARLESIEFRDQRLTFEVSENASWNGMPTAAQNATFLTVSWAAPSETIAATYDSLEQAHNQVQRLNGEIWNGRRIRVTLDDNTTCYIAPEIKIRGCVPGTAFTQEFYAFVETFNTKLLSSANYNLDEVFRDVREHLRSLPGVRMDSYEVLNNGNQLDAEAWIKVEFNDWEDAKRAHDTIDRKRLRSNFPRLRSWLPKPVQYSTKIPHQQYQAQKAQWDELSERKPDRDVHVHTRIGDRGDFFVRVLGQDKWVAGLLKVRVEGMVAGEKLDAAHWHTSFAFPRRKFFFARVFDEKKVYVRSDFKAHCLRVCGEPARVEEAKQMIREEVERLAEMETTIILAATCVQGFMREGLRKLKERIGEDNITVNVASWPYRVTVNGGVESTQHLQRLIDELRAMGALDSTRPRDAERIICPICTNHVSNPEELGCGHNYCSGCLSHFFTSAIDSKNFPLVCMGNGGRCRVPIAIPVIRRFLPHWLFENLIEAAFMAYLEQHPQELKYCPTLDCKQIYRRRTDKALLKCPACFSTICPMCDEEAHEGMTCKERNIHLDPGLHERLDDNLAREQGFKKCPQCSIFIKKTEGRNHMKCRCGAHICWICMRLFTEGTIYRHIREAHEGRIFDAVLEGANQGNAGVDEDVLVAAQIRETERFERERRAFEEQQQLAWAQKAAKRREEDARAAQRSEARRIGQEEQAREELRIRENRERIARLQAAQTAQATLECLAEELRIRENQERIARLQAAQTAQAALEHLAEEEKRRREEDGWCTVM